MYKEGRQIVADVAKEVDGIVKDAKTVHKQAKGIWGFFGSLFGSKSDVKPKAEAPKTQKKTKQKPPEFDENLIYQQVSDSLIKFFQAYNTLKNYIKEQEELALHQSDESGQETAIKLVIAGLQAEKLSQELSEFMIYHSPPELKDLYSRINKKIGEIAQVQAMARREEIMQQRMAKWQRRQKADQIQNRLVAIAITVLMLMYAWILIISLTH